MADLIAALCELPDEPRLMATDVLLRYGSGIPASAASGNRLMELFRPRDASQDGLSWSERVFAGWERGGVVAPDHDSFPEFIKVSLAKLSIPEGGWCITFDYGAEYATTRLLMEAGYQAGVNPMLSPVRIAIGIAESFGANEKKDDSSVVTKASALFSRGNNEDDPARRAHSRFVAKAQRTRNECLGFLTWLTADAMRVAAWGDETVDWPSSHLDAERLQIATTAEMERLSAAADAALITATKSQQCAKREAQAWDEADNTESGYRRLIANGPQQVVDLENERAVAESAVGPKQMAANDARASQQPYESAVRTAEQALAAFESGYSSRIAAAENDEARIRLTQEMNSSAGPLHRVLESAQAAARLSEDRVKAAEGELSAQQNLVRKLEDKIRGLKKDIERAHANVSSAQAATAAARERKQVAEAAFEAELSKAKVEVENLRLSRAAQLQDFDRRAGEFASWWPTELARAAGTTVTFRPGLAKSAFDLSDAGIRAFEETIREIASAHDPAAIATGQDAAANRQLTLVMPAAERGPRTVLTEMAAEGEYLDVLQRARTAPAVEDVMATYLITYDAGPHQDGAEREVRILDMTCVDSQALKGTGSRFWKIGSHGA